MLTPIIDGICRAEGPRLLAGLIRRVGDFELAEDAMQDAFTKALEVWPAQGLPASPAAWLTTVARCRALKLLRRRATGPLYTDEPPDMAAPEPEAGDVDTAALSGFEDDRLRLVFTCCHPAIAQPAQVALAPARSAACRRARSRAPLSSPRRRRRSGSCAPSARSSTRAFPTPCRRASCCPSGCRRCSASST